MNGGFLTSLKALLSPQYTPGTGGQGGHDSGHVLRMERMYEELSTLIPGVDREVYAVAVWLHNADRYPTLVPKKDELEHSLRGMLEDSGLEESVKTDIVDAIVQHGKFRDGQDDSPLLQMLRLADKWDRIGVMGAVSGFAWLGNQLPAYNPEQPFSYGSTVEGEYKTLYGNLFRIMEWYGDFPLIRELVSRHPLRFEHFLNFVRDFAREIAEAHGVKNTVEADIQKCLGDFCFMWSPA